MSIDLLTPGTYTAHCTFCKFAHRWFHRRTVTKQSTVSLPDFTCYPNALNVWGKSNDISIVLNGYHYHCSYFLLL